MQVLYEDNHLIIVAKAPGEIVQGDKTGDTPLSETVKAYLKERYAKPGNVFLGVVHRLDRPVSGVVVFARTSKALARLGEMFRQRQVRKTYWAVVQQCPDPPQATLTHWLLRNEQQNKSFVVANGAVRGAQQAILDYEVLAHSDRYHLVEVHLHTGRHHQIRCQLAAIGSPIRGDLKYGSPRSNPDGSICLHARSISFEHPVTHAPLTVEAPIPTEGVWKGFER